MNLRTKADSVPSAETKADRELQPIDTTSSPTDAKPRVACRFGLSHRLGVSVISWYVKLFNLSFEKELRLIAKWLMFIYGSSPFSKCRRKQLAKNVKSFVVLTAPVEWYLIAVSVVSLLQCCLVVYLTIKYIMK